MKVCSEFASFKVETIKKTQMTGTEIIQPAYAVDTLYVQVVLIFETIKY